MRVLFFPEIQTNIEIETMEIIRLTIYLTYVGEDVSEPLIFATSTAGR